MSADALPGLEPPARPAQPLEQAVRRTLAQLDALGRVGEIDAGKKQLAIELAQVIAIKKSSGRASTIGNDARVLMEILDSFVEDAGSVDEQLAASMREWGEYVSGHGTPEVRDPS